MGLRGDTAAAPQNSHLQTTVFSGALSASSSCLHKDLKGKRPELCLLPLSSVASFKRLNSELEKVGTTGLARQSSAQDAAALLYREGRYEQHTSSATVFTSLVFVIQL